MRLSVCLIVKNEEEEIEACLDSVREADEIIVCDTGSTDMTPHFAEVHTPHVYRDFTWCDDFSAARNHARRKATGDWIFSIDADHRLLSTIAELKAQIAEATARGFRLIEVLDQSGETRPVLWKNDPDLLWTGAVHENLTAVPAWRSTLRRKVGWSKQHERDPLRNLRILQAGDAASPRTHFYLAREYMDRRMDTEALAWFRRYLAGPTVRAERADAHYSMARIFARTGQTDAALKAATKALTLNANFRAAAECMAALSLAKNAQQWRRMAAAATNEGVLFTYGDDAPRIANILRPGARGDVVLCSCLTRALQAQGYMVNFYTDFPELASCLAGVRAAFPTAEWDGRDPGTDYDCRWSARQTKGYLVDAICDGMGLPRTSLGLKPSARVMEGDYITVQRACGWSSLKEYPHWPAVLAGLPSRLRVVELCEDRPWAETVSLIAHARMHIGGDSVCAHLAAAARTPAVVVFGSTDATVVGHRSAINLSAVPPQCAPCYIEDRIPEGHRYGEICPHGGCAGFIPPENVIAALKTLCSNHADSSHCS